MRYVLFSLVMLLASATLAPLQAQKDRFAGEAMETLRFIRLAETKKNLNLEEAKLLKLNEMLDDYEARRFQVTQKQMRLHHRIKLGFDREDAPEILKDLRQVREELAKLDDELWDRTEQILDPYEAIEFFQFYSNFQNEVRRRIRALRERPGQQDRPMFRRNKNRNRRNP